MRSTWRTAWQGGDIVVYKNDREVDRLPSSTIERVVLVHRASGDSPGDLVRTVVETTEHFLIFPPETGFAGRVNFEREAFWEERRCVYWVPESKAGLPWRLRRGTSWLGLRSPSFSRVPRADFPNLLDRWPIEGPQTWAQRKWRRIARSRPFAASEAARLKTTEERARPVA